MNTQVLGQEGIPLAAEYLRAGQPVAFPTETVYGLGCDATNPEAVKRVFEAKGRPMDNPLIVHIAELSEWDNLVNEIPPLAKALALRFWPGPLTIILPRSERIPAETAGGLDTVGVRFPAHPMAQAMIRAAGIPIAAPSANRSGRPSPTTAEHVRIDMNGRIPLILEGGSCFCGVESTVIALDDAETVRVLRPGFVTPEQLAEIAANVVVDDAVLSQLKEGRIAPSPGMKYKHYAPKADVILVQGDSESFLTYVKAHRADGVYALAYASDMAALESAGIACMSYGDTEEIQASLLFARLREADAVGAKRVYVRAPHKDGVGLAVYNRLIRSSGYHLEVV